MVIDILSEMAELHKILGDNRRSNAYVKAVNSLKRYKGLLVKEKLIKLKGIGKKLADKIIYITKNKDLPELHELRRKPELKIIKSFTRIYGVGYKKAIQWYQKGIRGIEELKKKDLNQAQWLYLQNIDQLEKKINRSDIYKYYYQLVGLMDDIDNRYIFELAGSYRRGDKQSGDIDLVVTHLDKGDFSTLIDRLKGSGMIDNKLSYGDSQWQGMANILINDVMEVRRIDITFCKLSEFNMCIAHSSNGTKLNTEVRGYAVKQWLTINNSGMRVNMYGYKSQKINLFDQDHMFDTLNWI